MKAIRGDDMKNKYISFLKMGDTDYPVELLKKNENNC